MNINISKKKKNKYKSEHLMKCTKKKYIFLIPTFVFASILILVVKHYIQSYI